MNDDEPHLLRRRPEAKASRSAPRPMTGIPEPAKKLPPWSERLEGKNGTIPSVDACPVSTG